MVACRLPTVRGYESSEGAECVGLTHSRTKHNLKVHFFTESTANNVARTCIICGVVVVTMFALVFELGALVPKLQKVSFDVGVT